MSLNYMSGFGNSLESEAVSGILPKGQNSPQKIERGLYAEQISGTAFTASRSENRRSWFYRILPSVRHGEFQPEKSSSLRTSPQGDHSTSPIQMRWNALEYPQKHPADFIDGLVSMAGNGNCHLQTGCMIHVYAMNSSMEEKFFCNADGELLIVPQEGALKFLTEFGDLEVEPQEILILPRGVKFQVVMIGETARGYVCENYGRFFRLPDLGPIGANGLANPRDFLAPTAKFKDQKGKFKLITKFNGRLWSAHLDCHPLNVVAWHGNYYPYKYDLRRFQVINTVSFDHPDPSIFTVLTSPSEEEGVANVDFVIFPPRWMVAQRTFRPPYYHRNCMSEFMGLIRGVYDAKATGFVPGGMSLHNCMSPHGPDAVTFEKASSVELRPAYIDDTLAFMFESRYVFFPTPEAYDQKLLQKDYLECWQGLKSKW